MRISPRYAAAVVAALALLGVAGCGSDEGTDKYPSVVTSTQARVEGSVDAGQAPTSAQASPGSCAKLPDPFAGVDACDKSAVAIAALSTMYSTNPTKDKTTQDAVLRAIPLLSSAMIGRIAAPATGEGAQSQNAEWADLRASGKRVVATVTMHKENQSTYYQITRKAIPADASDTTAGKQLDSIAASPTFVVVPGMGYRLDAINPVT